MDIPVIYFLWEASAKVRNPYGRKYVTKYFTLVATDTEAARRITQWMADRLGDVKEVAVNPSRIAFAFHTGEENLPEETIEAMWEVIKNSNAI